MAARGMREPPSPLSESIRGGGGGGRRDARRRATPAYCSTLGISQQVRSTIYLLAGRAHASSDIAGGRPPVRYQPPDLNLSTLQ